MMRRPCDASLAASRRRRTLGAKQFARIRLHDVPGQRTISLGVVTALLMVSCGFPQQATPIDGHTPDTNHVDALTPPKACRLTRTETGRIDVLGGDGGSSSKLLSCSSGQFAVGYAIEMSDLVTTAGARSARGVTQVCAPIEVQSSGLVLLTPESQSSARGTGNFGWGPSTVGDVVRCPIGSALVGMRVKTGSNGKLFREFAIKCAPVALDSAGAPSYGETTYVEATNTLTGNNGPDEAACNPGEQLEAVNVTTGAGLDSLQLRCAKVGCAP